jgi:hypothetical protein
VHERRFRPFKISHAQRRFVKVDLQKETSAAWSICSLIATTGGMRGDPAGTRPDLKVHALKTILQSNPDVRKLRAIWALHVTGGLTDWDAIDLLSHENTSAPGPGAHRGRRKAPDAKLRVR